MNLIGSGDETDWRHERFGIYGSSHRADLEGRLIQAREDLPGVDREKEGGG